MLAPNFDAIDAPLPAGIQYAVGFTSHGLSNRIGEHWHPGEATDERHHIFVIPTLNDPVAILGVLVHELCHAAAPAGAKHGPQFKRVATGIGLVGKMIHAHPGPELIPVLEGITLALGPLPHIAIKPKAKKGAPKPQPICRCDDCGYEASVTKKFLQFGPPWCPTCGVALTETTK